MKAEIVHKYYESRRNPQIFPQCPRMAVKTMIFCKLFSHFSQLIL